MPELPEVETFRRFLVNYVQGKRITGVEIIWPKLVRTPTKSQFISQITGQKIISIRRRGKLLLFFFVDNILVVHLRMEGRFLIRKKSENYHSKRTSAVFTLAGTENLYFDDARKFATFDLISKTDYESHKLITRLGLEPSDTQLTAGYLKQRWAKRTAPIKAVILEQSDIVGIGNIYASELLFAIGIAPLRPANQLTLPELKRLIFTNNQIMCAAILAHGTTIHTFSVNDMGGKFTNQLIVYGRAGKSCPRCKTKIVKMTLRQRGTFHCPKCQIR